ncbi:UNVERIFIED_CONTAM: hypothetical protein Slati_1361400 [Sesamum latifolium]|uniref:Uncharacterized protein n=1 Tax=Sesamum latifolium TaxID=2727402 RepID=A0AAW2XJT9_9LAMI
MKRQTWKVKCKFCGGLGHNKKGCTWRKSAEEFPAEDAPQPAPIAEDAPQPVPVPEDIPVAANVAKEIPIAKDFPSATQEVSQDASQKQGKEQGQGYPTLFLLPMQLRRHVVVDDQQRAFKLCSEQAKNTFVEAGK